MLARHKSLGFYCHWTVDNQDASSIVFKFDNLSPLRTDRAVFTIVNLSLWSALQSMTVCPLGFNESGPLLPDGEEFTLRLPDTIVCPWGSTEVTERTYRSIDVR